MRTTTSTLPQGEFTATLGSVKLGYFFTPRLYVQGLVQYSTQVDQWSTNLRLGWLNTAGTGLFVVYNDVQGFDTLQGPQGPVGVRQIHATIQCGRLLTTD